MKLWEADYSWEVDKEQGGYSYLYPTLAEARSEASKHMVEEMRSKEVGAAEYADSGKLDDDIESNTLTVSFSRVTVRKLDAVAICEIINSNGCYWMTADSRQEPVLTITMKPYWKKPKTTRHSKRSTNENG